MESSGLFFTADDNTPIFFQLSSSTSSNRLYDPTFSFIPRPFTICSSLKGHLLCRANTTYYLVNPLRDARTPFVRLPKPPRPHDDKTCAVLAWDYTRRSFLVICAVEQPPSSNQFIFDRISAPTHTWYSTDLLSLSDNQDFHIIPRSGISVCGRAYWLTEGPKSILSFRATRPWMMKRIMMSVPARGTLQLGRVRDKLALVCVTEQFVLLYHLVDERNDQWQSLGSLNVHVVPPEIAQFGFMNRLIVCWNVPLPLRFDGDNAQVLLLVDGRLLVWEMIHSLEEPGVGDSHESRRCGDPGMVTEIPWRNLDLANLMIGRFLDSVPFAEI